MPTADDPNLEDWMPPEAPGPAGWVALLSGLVPFMILWPHLGVLWVAGLAGMFWARRRPRLPHWVMVFGTLAATLPAAWVGTRMGDAIGGFGVFLALAMMLVLANSRTRNEHRIPFLLAFILLMAVGHKTLEIFYLLPVGLFFSCYALHRVGEGLEESPLPRWKVMLWLMVLSCVLAVPIFVLMPRTRLSVAAVGPRSQLSGFTGRVRFGEFSSIKLSDRLVMRVETENPTLLRGVTLDRYEGREWANGFMGTRSDATADQPLLIAEEDLVGEGRLVVPGEAPPGSGGTPPPPAVRDPQAIFTQRIMLEPFEQPILFGAAQVVAVYAPGRHLAVTTADNLIKLGHDSRLEKLLYTVYSRRQDHPRSRLVEVDTVERRGRFHEKYLQLPPDLPGVVAARTREVVGDAPTVLEKAERVQRWLGETFRYSLEREVRPEMDPVADLLTGDPRGHCEYFASAMAIMLRTVGVYTRVVVGFAPGEYNPYAETYSIRDQDAHAWVDVYFGREIGWVEFDPTPPDPDHSVTDAEGSALFLWLTANMDTLDAWWQNNVVNYYYNEGGPGAEGWLYRLEEFFLEVMGWRWLAQDPDTLMWTALRVLGACVAGVFALLGLRRLPRRWWWGFFESLAGVLHALLRWIRRLLGGPAREEGTGPGARGAAAALYREWLTRRARAGHPKPPTATPAEYAREVTRRDPAAGEAAAAVTRAYALEVYAERPDPEVLERARRLLGEG